ncbi:MAG TPA: hypothetical protein VE978_11535 [Chitinophagales bacterium]|nr:hypothetical protein [Chitinophagales bacterium]
MGFYPFESYKIKTSLQQQEIESLVASNIWVKTGYNSSLLQSSLMREWDKFEGRVQKNKFCINRVSRGNKDSAPLVVGRIKTQSGNSIIHVVIRWAIPIYLFMTVWFTGAFIAFFAFLDEAIQKGGEDIIGPFVAAGFIGGGYLIMTLPFKRESAKAKHFLNQLFKSQTK